LGINEDYIFYWFDKADRKIERQVSSLSIDAYYERKLRELILSALEEIARLHWLFDDSQGDELTKIPDELRPQIKTRPQGDERKLEVSKIVKKLISFQQQYENIIENLT